MKQINFELGPIRPPDEANSLLIRTTRSCPWNKCSFCTLFKGCGFSIRSVKDIREDIKKARDYYEGRTFESCFLQDGDSFIMKTADLVEILKTLKEAFPSLNQISSYGRAQTMIRKSPAEMKEIHDAGLNMLYCGMESGSDDVLSLHNKGTTSAEIIESSLNARDAGMKTMLFILLGLGGKRLSGVHITETARVLNSINPEMIRILTLAAKENTVLGEMVKEGTFSMLSEIEMIKEQRKLIDLLNNVDSQFGNYHSIDLFTELRGRLPDDKPNFLELLDIFLSMDLEKQYNFILGKRRMIYHRLSDMNHPKKFALVDQHLKDIRNKIQNPEDVFHSIRQQLI